MTRSQIALLCCSSAQSLTSASDRDSDAQHVEAPKKEVLFIGGVAAQRGMVRALEQRLGTKVSVPLDCEYVCALGAALLGLKRLQKLATSVT